MNFLAWTFCIFAYLISALFFKLISGPLDMGMLGELVVICLIGVASSVLAMTFGLIHQFIAYKSVFNRYLVVLFIFALPAIGGGLSALAMCYG